MRGRLVSTSSLVHEMLRLDVMSPNLNKRIPGLVARFVLSVSCLLAVSFEASCYNTGTHIEPGDNGANGWGLTGWDGCQGESGAVCSEDMRDFPLYFRSRPECYRDESCMGARYVHCNAACSEPSSQDRCDPSDPDGWEGCEGASCTVCASLLADYPKYLSNHPRCAVNDDCKSAVSKCSANCPAPVDADR